MDNLYKLSYIVYQYMITGINKSFRKLSTVFLGILITTTIQAAVIPHNISSGNLIIQGNDVNDYFVTGTTTTYRIVIGSGYKGTITLSNVSITSSGFSNYAVACGNGANSVTTGSCIAIMGRNNQSAQNPVTLVNLIIEGDNTLLYTSNQDYCAIQVDQGAQIHIKAIDENDNSSGTLVAKSSTYPPGGAVSQGGAGIGAISTWSGYNSNQGSSVITGGCTSPAVTAGGNIIISSGTITAWGGHGAGIGGSFRSYYNGIIVIYGGIVEARGGFDAAGIGSGCPVGTGVLTCYADNSTVIALPPSQITAYGAGSSASGGVGTIQFPELGLTGTKNLTYLNDPNKHTMTIHTEDYEADATIYLDLTQTTGLVGIFNSLNLDYDLAKVKVGKTNSSGILELHGQLEQNTTFFTDASSTNPLHLGRPYMPVVTKVMANKDIELPLLATNISFTDYPSIPLEEGYTATEAKDHAPHMKVEFNDPLPMTNVTFTLQGGSASDIRELIFLAADSLTVIPPPTTLNNGDVFFIIMPIKQGRLRGIYSDVLLIDGVWNSYPLPGYIRRIGEQRVVYDDTETNIYIKVTASPNKFDVDYPTTNTVTLNLNINHTGLPVPYDKDDVTAKYLVTTEANYNAALAATPLNLWNNLNVCSLEGIDTATIVSFSSMPVGTYYIHWYVVSGIVYAHSKDVTDPPRLYGGFGAYNIKDPFVLFDDYVQVLRDGKVIIDVKANDTIPSACASNIPGTFPQTTPAGGTATLVGDKIQYVPFPGFVGKDSMIYSLTCGLTTKTAMVRILVQSMPDNIIEADCYVIPDSTIWDIELKKMSNVAVHWLATPLVGDLDRDGRLEVVVPGIGDISSTIHVFNDQLERLFTITTPNMPQGNTTNLLIADVDNDGYGEIVIGTSTNQLMCYSHTGAYKWGPTAAYNAIAGTYCPSLIAADINADGYAEILAVDRIYDGEAGTLLVTLPAGGRGHSTGGPLSYMPVFADIDNDGIQEVVAGNTVYKINITNRGGTSGNSATILAQMPAPFFDGYTSVADIDLDGDLDVVVTGRNSSNIASMYVWDGATPTQIGNTISETGARISRAFIGDITGTKTPDIAYTFTNRIVAYAYNINTNNFTQLWSKPTTDASGATTMSMFDFNQDGKVELVYRDQTHLRIIDFKGDNIDSIPCYSGTHTEYPVIVDLDKDGHADILVSGGPANNQGSSLPNTFIMHFGSRTSGQWAPSRSVWNQHAYNAVNINEDLSIPRMPLNPATVFPGPDGIPGNGDDIRPYNSFLQQHTYLSVEGLPIWVTPDVETDSSLVTITVTGNSVTVTVGLVNIGDVPFGPPAYVTLYKDNLQNKMVTGSANIQIIPGDTGYVSVTIPDITVYNPVNILVRINDDGTKYPYHQECDTLNNDVYITNPALYLLMKKNATLNSVQSNGSYANPVSVLYAENIEYTISAVNANLNSGTTVIFRDTLPPYLAYVSSTPTASLNSDGGSPTRTTLQWTVTNVGSMASTSVTVVATPQAGVSASQPLFINRAWVTVSDSITVPTNSTYHQGAGISITTFSAGFGGHIYNAGEQALDYMTAPRSGIVIVPEEGYCFAGWSHGDYVSLRGKNIEAQTGIMHYDTLTIYGNVELQANFELEKYPVYYYLNGGVNAKNNPETYSIESGTITLEVPEKDGDVFIGWTGSNGEEPQHDVIIPQGSKGELEYFANYLNSGRENEVKKDDLGEDRIWAVKDELFVRASKTGSVVRIYSTEGVLQKVHSIITTGESKIKLTKGIYVVSLNNEPGKTVYIE